MAKIELLCDNCKVGRLQTIDGDVVCNNCCSFYRSKLGGLLGKTR